MQSDTNCPVPRIAYVRRQRRCVKLISCSIAVLWWSPGVTNNRRRRRWRYSMHGCSHYKDCNFPTLAVHDQVNGMLIATILSEGGEHWKAWGNTLSDARIWLNSRVCHRVNAARICVCGLVPVGTNLCSYWFSLGTAAVGLFDIYSVPDFLCYWYWVTKFRVYSFW